MRRLAILTVFLVSGWQVAHADSDSSIDLPSSTVPGCVNNWNATISGMDDTCEAKAAVAAWQERKDSVQIASNLLTNAANQPDQTDKASVIDALNSLAATADAITKSYHPQPPLRDTFGGNLAWMQLQAQNMKLPIPGSIGDEFRALAATLGKPMLLNADRNNAYNQAEEFADGFNEAIAETVDQIPADINAAVYKAHTAAEQEAHLAEYGATSTDGTPLKFDPSSAEAAIVSAAGPGHEDIGEGQFKILKSILDTTPGEEAGNGQSVSSSVGSYFAQIPGEVLGCAIFCAILAAFGFYIAKMKKHLPVKASLEVALVWFFVPFAAMAVADVVVFPVFQLMRLPGWLAFLVFVALIVVFGFSANRFVPERLKTGWSSFFNALGAAGPKDTTHGSARWGTAKDAMAANHLAPTAPADAFALGWMSNAPRDTDGRFRKGGHILTCAPTGAGKGIGAVIPNLLDYPGSAFVLDFKGENFAVTAAARQSAGQDVFLIDPFGITGTRGHSMNWLDALNPNDPDVVGLAASLADMLVVSTGAEADPHWNDTAKEFLRGLLIYVAGMPEEQRTMSYLRRVVTSSESDLNEVLEEMMADPEYGQRIVARAATAFLNRPEKERGSVLSTVVRHTAWLDDPRLAAAFSRSDFDLSNLKSRKVTVYLVIPPDRLRACLGFVRGFIGLALDAMVKVRAKPAHKVAFFLDEFGQLGHMASLADNITIMRGYGVQFWLFVQDLSQLKAVYPRWQSFIANCTQQYFGTNDIDTAKHISESIGQYTIRYQTSSQSSQTGFSAKGGGSTGMGEHLQGRSLLTPDEVLRLGPTQPIVMISGEAPYLLERINYLTDAAYAGRFGDNPQHAHAAE